MMRLFRRYVLGGKSDKTEGTLLAFLIGVGWTTYIIWKVAEGANMEPVIGLATTYVVTTLAAFTGATVVHHLKPPGEENGAHQGSDGWPEAEPRQRGSQGGGMDRLSPEEADAIYSNLDDLYEK